MKIVVLLFIFLILASLGSALYFMVRDKGTSSSRTTRALTWRVAFSIVLFALLMLGFYFGFIPTKL